MIKTSEPAQRILSSKKRWKAGAALQTKESLFSLTVKVSFETLFWPLFKGLPFKIPLQNGSSLLFVFEVYPLAAKNKLLFLP